VEQVYLNERKGFCKLALTLGADISPIYLYGATQLFDSVKPGVDSFLSRWCRRLGMSVMLFWGRGWLPIPYRRSIVAVCGKSLTCKQVERPSQVEVDELHRRVVEAVKELYEEHREEAGPEWVSRPLIIH
jgi:hypothetical protein